MFTDLKNEPTKPKNAPICVMVNPSMPMVEKIAKMGVPKKMPTTQPVRAPMMVPMTAYRKNIPTKMARLTNDSMILIIIKILIKHIHTKTVVLIYCSGDFVKKNVGKNKACYGKRHRSFFALETRPAIFRF